MPGDNYAPPRSGTAGRVGTALHADTDTVYRFTNTQIHRHKYTNTNSETHKYNDAPCRSGTAGLVALGYIALN